MIDADELRPKLGQPVPWTQTVVIMAASSIPIALGTWSDRGFRAAATFLAVMAATGIVAALFGRRSRAALIGYSLAVAVVSIGVLAVFIL